MHVSRGALVVAILAFTGCVDAPSGPSAKVLPSQGPSLAVTGNVWADASWDWLNTCGPTPEQVFLQGRLHIVFKERGDQFEVKTNSDAMKGVGQITGTEYVFRAKENTVIVPATTLPYTSTIESRYQLISRGGADNVFIDVRFVYSNPPFTILELTTTTECRG